MELFDDEALLYLENLEKELDTILEEETSDPPPAPHPLKTFLDFALCDIILVGCFTVFLPLTIVTTRGLTRHLYIFKAAALALVSLCMIALNAYIFLANALRQSDSEHLERLDNGYKYSTAPRAQELGSDAGKAEQANE